MHPPAYRPGYGVIIMQELHYYPACKVIGCVVVLVVVVDTKTPSLEIYR